MSSRLRCLIVEDQVMFLQLLQRLLQSQPGVEVVATAATAGQGIAACRTHQPDLVLLDLALPDGSGLRILEALLHSAAPTRAVVLSAQAAGFVCPEHLQPLLLGVIDKTSTYEVLLDVITDLLPQPCTQELLTPRQQMIFELIGQGLANKQIARRLELSVATVETHRKAIARRLGRSGAELVRVAALRQGGVTAEA
jgi:DNA-binding NarL/FixJ family response regulator